MLIDVHAAYAPPRHDGASRPTKENAKVHLALRRQVITQQSPSAGAIAATERACAPDDPDRVRQHIQDMLADYVAGKIVDSTFDVATEWWHTQDPLSLGQLAQTIDGTNKHLHDLLLGAPVERVADGLGLPDPLARLAGDVASAAELPTDVLFRNTRIVVETVGVCVGTLVSAPALTVASMKLLAHDALMEGVTEGIKAGLQELTEGPVRHRTVDAPVALDDLTQSYRTRESLGHNELPAIRTIESSPPIAPTIDEPSLAEREAETRIRSAADQLREASRARRPRDTLARRAEDDELAPSCRPAARGRLRTP
ncbi:MAG: hypothetical protein GEV11_00370 [Streptosporangiales bacterium]|nr:hypothetical protein [Streptosporangiales bacterium]